MSYKKFSWVQVSKVNLFQIPKTYLTINQWNKMYQVCLKRYSKELTRTPSHGISIKGWPNISFGYSVYKTNTYFELVIHSFKGWCRLIYELCIHKDTKILSGKTAFNIITKELAKDNINIDNYKTTDGYIKKFYITKPHIKMYCKSNKEYMNVHHLDLNSAYAAGIIKDYPELTKTYTRIYEKRHDKPEYKSALTNSIGFFQSKYIGYAYTKLALSAVNNTRYSVEQMIRYLNKTGRKVLLTNTDGIWYQGDIYNIDSSKLGGWKNDHKNCKFRCKSAGAYEFIENNIYSPVVRGLTKYDRVKDRSKWGWGDIFEENTKYYLVIAFDKKEGLKQSYEKLEKII